MPTISRLYRGAVSWTFLDTNFADECCVHTVRTLCTNNPEVEILARHVFLQRASSLKDWVAGPPLCSQYTKEYCEVCKGHRWWYAKEGWAKLSKQMPMLAGTCPAQHLWGVHSCATGTVGAGPGLQPKTAKPTVKRKNHHSTAI